MARARRWIRGFVRLLARALALGMVLLVAAFLLLTRTDGGHRLLLAMVVPRVEESLTGHLRAGRLDGDLLNGFSLGEIALDDADGRPAIRLGKISASYRLWELRRHVVAIDDIALEGLWIAARPLADGRMNLAAIARPSPTPPEPDAAPSAWRIELARVSVEGKAHVQVPGAPAIATRLHVVCAAAIEGARADVNLSQLELATEAPLAARLGLSAHARRVGDEVILDGVKLDVASQGPELARLAANVNLLGNWRIALRAGGRLDDLAAQLHVDAPKGTIDVDAHASLVAGAPRWRGTVTARDLDPAAALEGLPAAAIALDASGSGVGARGSITIGRLHVESLGARATLTGASDLEGNGHAELDLHASDLARLAALGVADLGGALDGHARATRRDRRLTLDADVVGAHLRTAAAALERLDVHLHASDPRGHLEPEGSLELSASDVRAAGHAFDQIALRAAGDRNAVAIHVEGASAELLSSTLSLDARARPTWSGTRPTGAAVTLDTLHASARGVRWQSEAPAELLLGPLLRVAGLRLASGDQTIAIDGSYSPASRALDATLRIAALDLASFAPLVTLPKGSELPSSRLGLDVTASGSSANPRVTVKLGGWAQPPTAIAPSPVELELGARYHDATLDGELAAHERGAPSIVNGRFTIRPTLAPDAPMAIELLAKALPLVRLRPLLPPRFADLAGAADASITVGGTPRHPTLAVKLVAAACAVLGLDHNAVEVVLDARDVTLAMDGALRIAGTAGSVKAHAETAIDPGDLIARPAQIIERLLHDTPFQAKLDVEGLDLRKLPFEALAIERPLRDGLVDFSAHASGTLDVPRLDAHLAAHRMARAGAFDDLAADADVHFANGTFALLASADLRGQRLLEASGGAPIDIARVRSGASLGDTPLQLELRVPAYDLAALRTLRPDLEALGGHLSAHAALGGTLADPRANASANIEGLRYGAVAFSQLEAATDFDGASISARASARHAGGGSLALDGNVPLDAERAWKLSLLADNFDLAFVPGVVPSLRTMRGELAAKIDLGGTRARPTVEGEAHLSGGSFQLRADPHLFHDLVLDADVHEGTAHLRKLAVASGDGTFVATGDATLDGLTPQRFDLSATAHDFALVFGALAARLDTALTAHGDAAATDGVASHIEIAESTVRLPRIGGTESRTLQSLDPLERVNFIDDQARAEAVEVAAAARAAASRPASSKLHFDTRIPGPFFIRSKEVNTELRGELHVLAGDELTVTGGVDADAGWVEIIGQRYAIDHARVAFSGPIDAPQLDVRITRQLTEATLIIEVHGTPQQPDLDLSSDPPIYDRSQILGIIISGDPASQQVSDRTLDQRLTGAVSSLVLGKIKDAIAPSLPIDVIHIETGESGYTGLDDTRLEIGKYVTESVYVSYIHQFGAVSTLTRANSNEGRLEYRFLKSFQLDASFGDAAIGGIDLFWTRRY